MYVKKSYFSKSDSFCLFNGVSLRYTDLVHKLCDNHVSLLSYTLWVTAVGAWTHRNKGLHPCCVWNHIHSKSLHSFLLLRGHEMMVGPNQRNTSGIHIPSKQDDCVPVVQKLLHCVINNAAGDDERASKVCHWLFWSLAITRFFSPGNVYSWHSG